MSLVVFKDRGALPHELRLIVNNDGFFDGFVDLPTAEQVQANTISDQQRQVVQLMHDIDMAVPWDGDNFSTLRGVGGIRIPKEYLSTGVKTAINILMYPKEFCFTLVECGDNVLSKVFGFTEGCVYWDAPSIEPESPVCDIIFNGIHYTDSKEAMQEIYEGL